MDTGSRVRGPGFKLDAATRGCVDSGKSLHLPELLSSHQKMEIIISASKDFSLTESMYLRYLTECLMY